MKIPQTMGERATVGVSAALLVLGTYIIYKMLFRKKIALQGNNVWQRLKMVKRDVITHDTRLFRFALADNETYLGLPIGKHIKLRFWSEAEKEMIVRPYTPISHSEDDVGYFELLIKIYPKGRMGNYLDELPLNSDVEVCGPTGRIEYDQIGHFTVQRPRNPLSFEVKHINMIAGGTGITPCYQVMQQILRDAEDNTKIALIFGNVSVDDILLQNELKKISTLSNVHVYFTVDKAEISVWDGGIGYVTTEMIKNNLYPPSLNTANILCGPPPMMKILRKTLINIGHTRERVLVC